MKSRLSQKQRVLALLIKRWHRDEGVHNYEITNMGILQYNARIKGLREGGIAIEHVVEPDGTEWFKLRTRPEDIDFDTCERDVKERLDGLGQFMISEQLRSHKGHAPGTIKDGKVVTL